MKIQKILLFILIFSLALPPLGWGQEADQPERLSTIERKQKSYSTALILGWDPVPGDGLFYTGHPAQGTLSAIIGALGGVLLGLGFAGDCGNANSFDDACGFNRLLAVGGGTVLYGTAYLWDGIGSTIAGKKFKK